MLIALPAMLDAVRFVVMVVIPTHREAVSM